MVSKTNEQALEAAIERALTGTCIEDSSGNLADATTTSYGSAHLGYVAGFSSDFNKQYAIDERYFWQFLERTQQPELDKLKKHNPVDWQRKLLERYDRLIKKYGILHLLKKGLSVDDAHFNLMYPAPLVSSSEAVAKNFTDNIFSCTRQLC
ncbi:MAG TPA: type I restriction endonuclease subunit R, partial [Pseudomonadales bacterium]|nr:type I restriction endonuclease subunit R [Pseudomonadales bacterium]